MIYFIQAGEGGPVKVGYVDTEDRQAVDFRLGLLQVGNHEQLNVLATMPGGIGVERELHEKLAAGRLRGEWFKLDAPGLQQTIHEAASLEHETSWSLRPDGEQLCEWCRARIVPLGRRVLCSEKCLKERKAHRDRLRKAAA